MNSTEPAAARRRLGVARRAGRRGRRRGSAAAAPRRPRAPSRAARPRARRRGRRARAPPAAAAGRPRTRRSRRSAAGPRGGRAWTSGQAASSRSTPLETISLPTKTTSGSPRPPAGRNSCDVDAGRAEPRLLLQARQVRQRRPERLARCGRSRRGRRRRPPGPRGRRAGSVGMGLDRVLERRAVDLGREGGDGGAGEDRRAHHQVVGEGGVDAAGRGGDLAHGGDVGVEVAVELGLAQLGERLDLEALVGVLDVDRQQAADLGVVDLDPLDRDLAVLAEQVDLVAEPRPAPGARLAL